MALIGWLCSKHNDEHLRIIDLCWRDYRMAPLSNLHSMPSMTWARMFFVRFVTSQTPWNIGVLCALAELMSMRITKTFCADGLPFPDLNESICFPPAIRFGQSSDIMCVLMKTLRIAFLIVNHLLVQYVISLRMVLLTEDQTGSISLAHGPLLMQLKTAALHMAPWEDLVKVVIEQN